ncbi:MAG: MATE family efflux transporter [Clostridia bacterium]|nr:MATE family efflux transporter [Clostridia bacterium]
MLTWPIFIELLLQILVSNADQIMVGWRSPNGVGAIGNANQITNLLVIVFSVVCTASMILIAQYFGARDTKKVEQTYTISLLVNLIFGVFVSLLLVFGCVPIFRMMGVKTEIFDEACLYIRIVGAGMWLQAIYLTYTAFFRSSQMMKETMAISVGVNLLNIAGNAILINGVFGPPLGVAGAAISSVVSRLVGVVVIAVLFRKKFGKGALALTHLKPFPVIQLKKLLAIGLPTGGEAISYSLSQVGVQSICNRLTLAAVNTRVYASMFANFTYLFGSAISQATQVVVARLMGALEIEETDRRVKATLWASLAISAAVSVLLYLLCEPVYRIFTRDSAVLALAKTIMLIEIPLELGRAVNMVMCRCLQACGDIKFPTVICVVSAWLIAVGGGYVLAVPLGWGLAGLWAAMAVDECLRAVLFLFRWRSRSWTQMRLLG